MNAGRPTFTHFCTLSFTLDYIHSYSNVIFYEKWFGSINIVHNQEDKRKYQRLRFLSGVFPSEIKLNVEFTGSIIWNYWVGIKMNTPSGKSNEEGYSSKLFEIWYFVATAPKEYFWWYLVNSFLMTWIEQTKDTCLQICYPEINTYVYYDIKKKYLAHSYCIFFLEREIFPLKIQFEQSLKKYIEPMSFFAMATAIRV